MTPVRQLSRLAWCLVVAAGLTRAGHASPRLAGLSWHETAPVQTDGLVEPGEAGRVAIVLWNDSAVDLTAVSGTLRVVAPAAGVVARSNATSWPDLPPGGRAPDAGGLVLDVAPSVACGALVRLELDVLSSNGAITIPVELRTGLADPAALPPVTLSFGGSHPHAAIRGDVVGAVARADDGVTSWIHFARFDAVTGARLGSDLTVSGQDRHRYPRIGASADRWCLAWLNARFQEGYDAWISVRADDGAEIASQRVHLAEADYRGAFAPDVASDGSGFGIVFRADRLGDEAQSAREIVYVHVDANGIVDAGPIRIDVGMSTIRWTLPIVWTGSEFAVLAAGSTESRLVRILPDGTARVGPALPATGREYAHPAMTSTGHGLALVTGETLMWLGLLPLFPDGTARQAPGAILAYPSPGYFGEDRPSKSIAWDGSGHGVAVTAGLVLGPGSSSHVVVFTWLDAEGRRYRADLALTPTGADQHVGVVGNAVFDGARDEFRIPVVDGAGWEGMALDWQPVGTLRLLRVARNSACPAGEAPREVSGTAATALRVRKEWGAIGAGDPGSLKVVASFEDLGAEASAYNLSWANPTADLTGFESFRPGFWQFPDCGLTPQPSPYKLRPDGAGRLAWWAGSAAPGVPGTGRRLAFLFVTASNQWGESPRGRDSDGAPIPSLPGCYPDP